MTSQHGSGTTTVARGCCVARDENPATDSPGLHGRQRAARAVLGLVVIAGAAAVANAALGGWWLLWPLAAVAAWFGTSHVVAALTGYRGCPEIGAIPSLFMRRPLATHCGPWDRLDRRLTGASGGAHDHAVE